MSDEQDDFRKMVFGTAERAGRERRTEPQPAPRSGQARTDTARQPGAQRQTARANPNYRFLNPYNFIRYLDKPRPRGHIFGSCPPPPHDRYVGLTGRIQCEIETVSPLFVSDSHGIEPDKEDGEHLRYRFFKYGGKHAIPASSLRGMIRNVYEAVTNSCFSVFDDHKLSYHFSSRRAPWLVPARVENEGEVWRLRLLPGSTTPRTEKDGKQGPEGTQYAAWAASYWPIKPSGTLKGERDPRVRDDTRQREFIWRTETPMNNPDGVKHGEECWALLRERQHPHPKIRFWDMLEVRRRQEDLPKPPPNDKSEIQQFGWLCVTNQNIEVKHSERFFFHKSEPGKSTEIMLELLQPVRAAYESLIADYQDRHESAVQKLRTAGRDPAQRIEKRDAQGRLVKEPAFSRFIVEPRARHLRDGDLVYALLQGSDEHPTVSFIAPVSVPRVGYENTLSKLMWPNKQDLCRCTELGRLCPACRLFGWVREEKPKDQKDAHKQEVAYASRLRVSHAEIEGKPVVLPDDVPLAILGSPKPTTTAFYLRPRSDAPDAAAHIWNKGYDADARLRGRKFYRHHEEAQKDEYKRKEGVGSDGKHHSNKDDQNRTVCGALDVGNRFRFTIDFHNLAAEELGALLWVLELEEGRYHRLGFAKPLGFGSIKVRVTALDLVSPDVRYSAPEADDQEPALPNDGGWIGKERSAQLKEDYIKRFKAAVAEAYSHKEGFEAMPNVIDLLALTGKPPLAAIHYPRMTEEQDPAGKNFEWFVENNRRQAVSLALAAEEMEANALPLRPGG